MPDMERLTLISEGEWSVTALELDERDRQQYACTGQQDPAWLAHALARQHGAIARLNAAVPIYPLQFGVVVPDAMELLAAARLRADDLRPYFALVDGAYEWAMKIYWPDTDGDDELARQAAASSGRAWLQARRQAPERAQERLAERQLRIIEMYEQWLSPWVRARVSRSLTGGPRDTLGRRLITNDALLVGRDQEPTLNTAILQASEQLAASGMQISVTGPWAPYTFRPRLTEDASEM